MKPAAACAMTRREMIRRTSIVAAGVGLAGYAWPLNAASAKTKKILFFSKSSGYEHSVIKRNGNGLSFAEKILAGLGPKNGIEFTFSKDGSLFSPEYVAQFDAFCFYTLDSPLVVGTDGFPAMTPAGKAALLDAVKNGKGFIGVHSASDTFHSNAGEDGKTKEHLSRYKNYGAQADDYTRRCSAVNLLLISTKQQKNKIARDGWKISRLAERGCGN